MTRDRFEGERKIIRLEMLKSKSNQIQPAFYSLSSLNLRKTRNKYRHWQS